MKKLCIGTISVSIMFSTLSIYASENKIPLRGGSIESGGDYLFIFLPPKFLEINTRYSVSCDIINNNTSDVKILSETYSHKIPIGRPFGITINGERSDQTPIWQWIINPGISKYLAKNIKYEHGIPTLLFINLTNGKNKIAITNCYAFKE